MKLLKKILPFAAVASTAAIVAPVITSCASNTIFQFDATEEVKTTGWKRYDKTKATRLDATIDYWDAIYKDPTIFENDMVFGKHKVAEFAPYFMLITYSRYFDSTDVNKIQVKKYDVTLENLKVKKTDVITAVSYKATVDILIEGPAASITTNAAAGGNYIARFQTKYTLDVENCPIFARETVDTEYIKMTSLGTSAAMIYRLYLLGYMPSQFKYGININAKVGFYDEDRKTFVNLGGQEIVKTNLAVSTNETNIIETQYIWESLFNPDLSFVIHYMTCTWPSFFLEQTKIQD